MSYEKRRNCGNSANPLISWGNTGSDRKIPAVVLALETLQSPPSGQQKRAAKAALSLVPSPQRLEGAQVLGRGLATTRIGHGLVGDLLTFLEVTEASALDGGDVNEHVRRAVFRLNKTKALGGVEPLNSTGSHG